MKMCTSLRGKLKKQNMKRPKEVLNFFKYKNTIYNIKCLFLKNYKEYYYLLHKMNKWLFRALIWNLIVPIIYHLHNKKHDITHTIKLLCIV